MSQKMMAGNKHTADDKILTVNSKTANY